jgi:ABC-type transport system involved in multi-copper enzyme maturation permease subunit
MSAEPLTAKAAGNGNEGKGAPRLPWDLLKRQTAAILRLEVRKSFFGRSAVWAALFAMMPVIVLALRNVVPHAVASPANLGEATSVFANAYQLFILRLVIFFGCVSIFGNLIRREMLDRSLHYYFLSPVRRDVLVVAKYLTGLLVSVTLFGLATALSYVLAYLPHTGLGFFFLHGPGLAHLAAYLFVTFLACLGYGAIFLTFSLYSKSPAIPALVVFGWELINFLLPPLLKKISMIYYLESLCPVPVSLGPFALTADAPSPWLAVPGIFLLTAALLALSGRKIRRMEISYEED